MGRPEYTIRDSWQAHSGDAQDREDLVGLIMEETGCTRKAVLRKLRDLEEGDQGEEDIRIEQDWDDDKDAAGDTDEVKMLALLRENSMLKSRVKKASIEKGSRSLFLDDVLSEIRAIRPSPLRFSLEKGAAKKKVTEVWHWTDWHIGEVILPSEIEDLNEFNYGVAKDRVSTFIKKSLDWTMLHRNNYVVDELVIVCTGDMISGDIHDELTRTNEFPLPEQCVKAGQLIAEAVAAASPHFKTIRVEYICADNHSRLTKKPQAKQAGINSVNYLVGNIAQLILRDCPNVKFNLYPVVYQLVKVQDMRYLCCHGNNIRSFGSIPRAGMQKLVGQEAFYRMRRDTDLYFDKLLMGHYHTASFDQTTIMGSSLSGVTEYDRNCGRMGMPSQTAWFVYDKYEFDWTEFFLD